MFAILAALPALAQTTTRVSVSSAGADANGNSGGPILRWIPAITADGRFVAFTSEASNLAPNDTNNVPDVFIHDRETGETRRVSLSSTGTQPNGECKGPSISADGRFIAFECWAANLFPFDFNMGPDVFVRDSATGQTLCASVDTGIGTGNAGSGSPSISGDGRFVAFQSYALNLIVGDSNGVVDIFVRDLIARTTERVSLDSMGGQNTTHSFDPAISADGRFVAFDGSDGTLVPNDRNSSTDVFVHDRQTGETSRVSVSSAGIASAGASYQPSLSGDGRFVTFASEASGLVGDDLNGQRDIFVHDRLTGETRRASVDSSGLESDYGGLNAHVSSNGRFVAFASNARNLVINERNFNVDVYVKDLAIGATTLESVDSAGIQGEYFDSVDPVISGDGRFVAFCSNGPLVPDDHAPSDVYVRDREPCGRGTVNSSAGRIADVLFVDDRAGLVRAHFDLPIRIRLDAPPAGPISAAYVVWVWAGIPASQLDVIAGGHRLGCSVNPTPLVSGRDPQAIRCLRSGIVARAVCRGVSEIPAPAHAPWTRTLRGFAGPVVFTMQGVIRDDGAGNASGASVTNAVILMTQP